jgi:hypothetical protein
MSDNTVSARNFSNQLRKMAQGLNITIRVVVRKMAYDAFTRLTMRTPVDTGRARASWDIKQGSPSDFIPDPIEGKNAGSGNTDLGTGMTGNSLGAGALTGGTTHEVTGALEAVTGREVVYITTALDYMRYLEQGHSKQAPSGMVALTVAEMAAEIDSILAQIAQPAT